MAVAHNGTDSKAETSAIGSTISWSHTVSAGTDQVLIVSYTATSNFNATSVLYGVAPLTLIDRVVSGANRHAEQWILKNPTVGTDTVSITLEAGPRTIQGFAACYTGVNQNSPVGPSVQAIGDASSGPDPNVSGLAGSTSMVVDVVMVHRDDLTEAITVGSGQTSRGEDVSSDGVVWMQAGISEKLGATSMAWACTPLGTSNIWAHLATPLQEGFATRVGTYDPALSARAWF